MIFRRLALKPLRQFAEPIREGNLRHVPEHFPRQRNVGETIADIAHSVTASDLRFDMLAAESNCHCIRYLGNAEINAAADIENLTRGFMDLKSEPAGLSDILHADEI